MSYHTFTGKITLGCFLFRFVLHRSVAIKTEQDSSVKQRIVAPVSKTLQTFKVIHVLVKSKPKNPQTILKTIWAKDLI